MVRGSGRLALVVGALVGSIGLGFSACGGEEREQPAAVDGGTDAPLLGDGAAPDADAEVPVGDVCGNAAGLEKDAPWPMRGACPKRSGVSPNPGPQTADIKWSLPIPAGESSPAIAADRLIWVGTKDGDVLVLFPNGSVYAALRTGGPVRSSPVRSATGLTVVGSSDGTLYGVHRGPGPGSADAGADGGDLDGGEDGGDGGVSHPVAPAIFRRPLAPISSSPAIGADGTIYVGTTDGKLVAVAADGSATKWSVTTNDTLGSSPAIGADETIYVGSSDRRLYAFAPDGATRWSYETGGAILGSPAVGGDESVYVGSSDGKLYAITAGGKLRWTYTTGGPITGTPAVRGGVLYVGSDDKKLHAVSTPTGEGKWTYATLGAVATPVIGPDQTVYAGSLDGRLYAITPSGLLFFAVNAKGAIRGAPAIGDDLTLYVTTDSAIVAIGQ